MSLEERIFGAGGFVDQVVAQWRAGQGGDAGATLAAMDWLVECAVIDKHITPDAWIAFARRLGAALGDRLGHDDVRRFLVDTIDRERIPHAPDRRAKLTAIEEALAARPELVAELKRHGLDGDRAAFVEALLPDAS